MPMEKPLYFKKVLETLRQLSTSKGFSIRQIAEHLLRLGIRRDPKDIRSIVEQSVKYGVKNKLLQERCGKFHLTAARLQTPVQSAAEKKKKKRVRFKKGKTNINDALKRTKSRKNRKSSKGKSNKRQKYKRPSKSKQDPPIPETFEYGEATEPTSQERSPNDSKSALIVESKESKEALDVTPDRDVHSNCVNKNRDRSKQPSNVREPPELEPETEIGWQPPRPPTKLSRRSNSRHSSKLRKDLPYKCKHSHPHQCKHSHPHQCKHSHQHQCKHSHPHLKEQRKRLRDYIPDDKTFRNYKTRSRRHHDHEKSEERSHCNCNFKERKCRKCHSHYCTCKSKRHCYHQRRHYNSESQLERKSSNTNLDQLDKTVLDTVAENLTPFEIFLEANHNELETIVENTSVEDEHAEEVEQEEYSPSYIN